MKLNLINRNCQNCGDDSFDIYLKSKDYRFRNDEEVFIIVKCKKCGFVYLNPIFPESDLNKFYGKKFYSVDGYFLKFISKIIANISNFYFIRKIKKYKINGRVLDVGCGSGVLVKSFIKNGFDAYGIEINKDAKSYVNHELRNKIYFDDLRKFIFKNKFDLITVNNVLEHVYDIKSFLKEIKNNLKDNGLLYLKVPNINYFEYKIFKNYSYNLEIPRHLYFFTKNTLINVLHNNGFKKIIFLKSGLNDLFVTPASFYYPIKYYLKDRKYKLPLLLDRILFFLMLFVKFLIEIIFHYQGQEIQVFAYKDKTI